MQFIAVSVLTFDLLDSYLEAAEITYQTLLMLTKVLRLKISIFCNLSMFYMLCYVCEDSQTTAYMKHVDNA